MTKLRVDCPRTEVRSDTPFGRLGNDPNEEGIVDSFSFWPMEKNMESPANQQNISFFVGKTYKITINQQKLISFVCGL